MRVIKYIVIHCTAGSQDESQEALIRGFRARGWKNNGYHVVIDADGSFEEITPLDKIANGVAGHNANSIHVSYKGGVRFEDGKAYPVDNRTDAQKKTLIGIIKDLKKRFPKAIVLGHRDFSPDKNKNGTIEKFEWIKACPCFDAKKEYKDL